ncbi:hypothetical protein K440DRAFT_642167 [Wilcoxina mikolae CBS 423.85]|nr:hypothetical protein K440DRAFT_642167 [Wilcoxina mikolae CBS 423.85]
MPEDANLLVNHFTHRDEDIGPNQLGFSWQLAWDKRNFKLLSLLFSERYSSAGDQLAFAGAGGALEVMNAAIKANAIDLVEALVAQRETLRSQLPQYQVGVFDQIATKMIGQRRGRLYTSEHLRVYTHLEADASKRSGGDSDGAGSRRREGSQSKRSRSGHSECEIRSSEQLQKRKRVNSVNQWKGNGKEKRRQKDFGNW